MIRVMIVDDHRIVREGLRQVLADYEGVQVVAEAAHGAEALQALRSGQAVNVVLLDIALPGRDGLEVLKQIQSEFAGLPVLMLSTYPDNQFAVRCIRAGAAGYLNKSADPDDIVAGLRKAASGGRYLTPSVADLLANAVSEVSPQAPHESLSQRENQVFRLLAQGQSVGQIAALLNLSSNTVSTYRARILEKTGTRNDVELALYAVRQQVVSA
nr:response regulator transcription factor [uncultured Aquabacterium sp.]